MTDSLIAISFKNVSYSYRHQWTGKQSRALNSLNLEVKPGEFFGFLGRNGAGKTTTIKCALSLIRPSSGSISLLGVNNRETSSRKHIGYIPEQPYFYDHLTVREIVELYAILSGLSPHAARAATTKALDTVGVSARSKAPMRSLSKGLTQRVALAQAIVADPKILILDEPFSGLDPIGRREFRTIFSSLNKSGTTIFMSSHVLGDVEALCNRVSIMVKGELQGVFDLTQTREQGSYELIIRGEKLLPPEYSSVQSTRDGQQTLWRCSDRKTAEQLLQWAVLNGCEVTSFNSVRQKLEDLFIELVSYKEGEAGQ